MSKFFYDLHIHSCLSPCGDDDNTPNNVAGMASLCGLDIVALTDHNTTRNCPAFFEAAQRCGIIPVAGMELTTSEDIHVVCLFERLEDAMAFNEFVSTKRVLIKNRPSIFGRQTVLDGEDNEVAEEEYLLTNATEISVMDATDAVNVFGGVCYPAHIDRDSNGILAILGAIPHECGFERFEMHGADKISEICNEHSIDPSRIIVSSDAHYLTDMRDKEAFFDLDADRNNPDDVRTKLFKQLRGKL